MYYDEEPDRYYSPMEVARFEVTWMQKTEEDKCACGGGGWILHGLDYWFECGVHYKAQTHPEDYEEE